LGTPYGALAGLDVQDWGDGRLIHSLADLDGLHRVWIVVLDGETPAVDMDGLRRKMKQSVAERVGAFQIMRFE
jgi:hypothetical protein